MIPLVFATRNEKKLEELRAILADLPVVPTSLRHFKNLPPVVEEDGKTFEENAIKKATVIARWSRSLALADDSGLCVDALNGAPGVYSARFAGESQDDSQNCKKLLQMMEGVPEKDRTATFICVVAVADLTGKLLGTTRGQYPGKIAFNEKGDYGFGYDPVFIDPASGMRFAELLPDQKNKISHRAQALSKVKPIIQAHLDAKRNIDKRRNVI